ncbi:tRNA lysidine(34) synthetase TilS [Thiomicrorhabdus heinhorstiae]|uniref:tRNA(Ile)-lysidine synthase n=1 Tax=Thiomicrorhabdus heinhorstiae TaxID=2748010 RepID=A0ABS0BXN9_9GAMM|nr:tRNA lysidine(34) synthetase TilS [Thiomicrorhabdus heinhorstiae]MBF6056837.1 tRNA lysidine(34) synthetase TilS [Thiomicrorhabdus heinhorstiae]
MDYPSKPDEIIQLEQSFADFFERLPPNLHFALAYSGGLDSSVLLHLLQASSSLQGRFYAVHINHGLVEQAEQWCQHCVRQSQDYDVVCRVKSIQIDSAHRTGLEARARQLRYQAIFDLLDHPHDVVLTAHHQRDQVETFFLKLLRGAGVKGLAGIRQEVELPLNDHGRKTLSLMRPLLKVPYSQLQAYASYYQLRWVEDPSNQDHSFERNRVRHELLPHVLKFEEHAFEQVQKACSHLGEADILLRRMAQRSLLDKGHHFLYFDFTDYPNIDWIELKNIISLWLMSVHGLVLSERHYQWLREIREANLSTAKSEYRLAQASLWFYHNRLYCLKANPNGFSIPFDDFIAQTKVALGWDNRYAGKAELSVKCDACSGYWYFYMDAVPTAERFGDYKIESLDRISEKNRFKNKQMKGFFQQRSIPVWERKYWPVLTLQGVPVAVLGCQNCLHGDASIDEFFVKKEWGVSQKLYWSWMGLFNPEK